MKNEWIYSKTRVRVYFNARSQEKINEDNIISKLQITLLDRFGRVLESVWTAKSHFVVVVFFVIHVLLVWTRAVLRRSPASFWAHVKYFSFTYLLS